MRTGASRITPRALRITRGFTLMEVMLALTVSAIVLAAIGGVFFAALRLRDRTAAALDETAPLYQALSIIRRDFQGALPPGSALLPTAGDFKTDPESVSRIQLFTTTGVLNDDDPWGDVQEVIYDLRDSSDHRQTGKDLYRTVSRNVLASGSAEGVEMPLLSHVQTLEFSCYDGSTWRSWDTSMSDTNLPVAVRIRLRMAGDSDATTHAQEPYELVIPLLAQSRTNQPQTTSTGGAQ